MTRTMKEAIAKSRVTKKKFDGKIYKYVSLHLNKPDAEKQKKNLQDIGYKVRVTKTGKQHPYYEVWCR